MTEYRSVLERAGSNAPPLDLQLERILRRRDRKRRNQRIVAGVVGIAVFVAAVWVVATGGPFDRTAGDGQQPATSGATIPAVEPTPATRAWGPVTTATWVGASAIPEVDYVIDLDTGATTPLPAEIIQSSLGRTDEIRAASHYAVSPDGAQLAYVGTGEQESPQIFIAGDGVGVRQVTNDPVGADWPAWSPDGTKIAYEGGGDLFVLDVATGESTQIADGVALSGYGLQFTPDGSSLVYTGVRDLGAEMRTVPVAGGQSTILFGGGHRGIGAAGSGSLSPDGSLVTFMGHEVDGPGGGQVRGQRRRHGTANDPRTQLESCGTVVA